MKSVARSSISTNNFGKAYLTKVWSERSNLSDSEWRGFAQFFYVTLCGHIESVLVAIIKARISSINSFKWHEIGSTRYHGDGFDKMCSLKPVYDSIVHLSEKLRGEVEVATLTKLIEMHNKIFPKKLSEIAGSELAKDLDALASLRNIFAHGREFIMELEFDENQIYKGNIDGNPLKSAAQRLLAAGIINSMSVDGTNHHEFLFQFYKEESLLHFYNVVQEIEKCLISESEYEPELAGYFIQPLPVINA